MVMAPPWRESETFRVTDYAPPVSEYQIGETPDSLTTILRDLVALQEECGIEGWDGDGARPVSGGAIRHASEFLQAVLTPRSKVGFPLPSVLGDPDGHVAIEWYRTPRHTVAVTVGPEGEFNYSALLGNSQQFGTERDPRDAMKVVRELLSRMQNG
jgi:hypothetical protein